MSNYYLMKKGEFTYNKSYSGDYPWGAVKRLDRYDEGCLSSLYICFSLKPFVNSDFITHYFETTKWYRGVSEIAGEGARNHGLLNIAIPDYFATKHYLPASSEEQQKIADLFNLLTKRIETQIRVIEDLQTLKKAISSQLLYGGSLKDIISLAKLGTLKNGYAFKSSTYCENGNYNIITIANVTGERYVSADGNRVLDQPCDIQEHQLLKENDILISLTGNVGRVSLNKGTCNLLNQRVGLFELRDNSLREYIFQVLSTPQFESAMKNKGQGAAQMNIGKYDIEEYHIPYSIDHNELLKISEILSLFDSKILMENKLLQLFTQQKTFLLQKMFI